MQSFSIVAYQGWAGHAGVTRRIVDFSFCTFARHWNIKQILSKMGEMHNPLFPSMDVTGHCDLLLLGLGAN